MEDLALCHRWFDDLVQKVIIITKVSDLDAAADQNKAGIILGYQNLPAEGNPETHLSLLYKLGVRIIQPTHNKRNLLGDGCSEPCNAGLSQHGRHVIEEMNRLGILIDLSHVGENTYIDILELSSSPVAITHTNANAVFSNPRNKSNRVLDALAANGGVIGVTFLPPMIRSPSSGEGSLDDVLSQFDYIADRIGPEHVGIGSDFIEGQPQERYSELLSQPDIYGGWPWRYAIRVFPDCFYLC